VGAETLIVAKRFQLPGGGESVPGEPIAASDLGKAATVERLLRIGYVFGYDAGGNPVKESRDFAGARKLAPGSSRAAPPVRDPEVPISFGGAETGAEDAEPGGAAPSGEEPREEVTGGGRPGGAPEEPTGDSPKRKRRRRKSTSKKG
jgi:hypothetical protein